MPRELPRLTLSTHEYTPQPVLLRDQERLRKIYRDTHAYTAVRPQRYVFSLSLHLLILFFPRTLAVA
jgi:hypothetical protein